MNVYDYANTLLNGTSLEDKLFSPDSIEVVGGPNDFNIPVMPGREKRIDFSEKQAKFPKAGSFHLEEKRAMALHFFANHELLAIEMMAAAILKLPSTTKEDLLIKKGLIKTIKDEQKHFSMYVARMNEFGVELGDYPLNDFFWRQMSKIEDYSSFFSVMALTFEQANLDFADFYRKIFKEIGDEKTANIMNVVFEDEISHVAFGRTWLNLWKKDKSLWEYYKIHLPENLTPARAKGIVLNIEARERAGLDEEFINSVQNYRDDYTKTNRKSWDKE